MTIERRKEEEEEEEEEEERERERERGVRNGERRTEKHVHRNKIVVYVCPSIARGL